jgi:hypothetical protein
VSYQERRTDGPAGKRRLDVDSENWLLIGFNSSIKFVKRNPVGLLNQKRNPVRLINQKRNPDRVIT